ncbi:MAG: N-acetylmuramoyl-L-alanine amidase [Lewinellaceae bacterium]|nr:N-acetylmuramoyl-L-alanine amidase [Lewinellaceae bacterium]
MNLKFALRTILLPAAWLVLQNFNLPAHSEGAVILRSKSRESCYTANPVPPSAYRIKKVVLDAGHGGKDPGCIGAASKEKDNALAIVLKLGAQIEAAHPDVEVIYTRKEDVFIELNERAAIANRNNADLFISVHCNAIRVSHVNGTETYVMGLHTAAHNLEVAKRENASIYLEDNYQKNYEGYDPNSPEAHIMGSVWQSAYLEQSILFASLVQQQAKSTASRVDKGVKQAGFLVLRETAMPSVLVETGYLTNRNEEAYIASEIGQTQMAQAIFEAFEAYKTTMEGNTTEPAKTQPPLAKTPPATAKGHSTGTSVAKTSTVSTSKPVAQAAAKPVKVKNETAAEPVKKTETGPFRIFLLSWPLKMDRNAGQLGLIGDITEEKIDDKYHYFTGQYKTREEAEKMLPEIRNLGFRTAAIVPAGGR